jgi:hypothetical protein
MSADLATVYLATEISIALPHHGWTTAAEAIAELPMPVFVLTAWNPDADRPGPTENRARNRLLRDRLADRMAIVHPAIGASPGGEHFEESFAVSGLGRDDALALGREFGQVAIFELTASEQTVLACDGSWTSSGRFGQFPSAPRPAVRSPRDSRDAELG